jgi:hypothetical protein
MNESQFTSLTNLANWLMIAEGITLIFLFILVFHFKRLLRTARKNNPSFWNPDQLRKWAKESENICLSLSQNLEEKKAITKRLMEQLHEKIQSLYLSLEAIGEKRKSLRQSEKETDLYGQVVKMLEAGYKFPEITRTLKLPKGEVQLILDLKQYSE